MLFISKSPELTIVIRRDVSKNLTNSHGITEPMVVQPTLYANFKPKALDGYQRKRADERFRQLNPEHPYGATPYSDNGIMGSQFNEEEISPNQPESYKGFNPVHMLGRFDTSIDIVADGQPEEPAEVRRIVEEFLLKPEKGLDDIYILMDAVALEKPWPNYPLEGQGRHKTILAAVKTLGIDPGLVIAFEQAQEKPGAGVISEMEALVAEREAEDAEHAALGAEIPA